VFYLPIGLCEGKISARKIDIRFVGRHLAIGKNFSKIPITLDRRSMGTNPLEVFHTSLRSTYQKKMGPKGLNHLGRFPRKPKFIRKNLPW
jgi:hypothetical protein